MEKINKLFIPKDALNLSNIEDNEFGNVEILENGLCVKDENKTVITYNSNITKYYQSGTPTFLSDLLKFFDNKYKFYELYKISNGVSHFKANLLRYATKNLFEDTSILKQIYNYSDYDRYRCPIDYTLYKTGPDEDEIEGVTDGVFYLQLGSSEDSKVVLEQYLSWTGALILHAYAPNRETIKELYKTLFNWMNENNFLKNKKINSKGEFLKLNKEGWNDIVLEKSLQKMLQKHLIDYIDKFDLLKEKGLPTSRGFLLHGDPGNGKTTLGKVLANNSNCTFIWVPQSSDNSTLYSEIFSLARELSPTIIFMEDLASQGGMDRRGGVTHAALGTLLNLLSGIESNSGVITFATENYIENLDVAIRNRPGRFDYILELKNPDLGQRIDLLAKFLPEYSVSRTRDLAKNTENFSCAHIRELANRLLIEDDSPDNDILVIREMKKTFGIIETENKE